MFEVGELWLDCKEGKQSSVYLLHIAYLAKTAVLKGMRGEDYLPYLSFFTRVHHNLLLFYAAMFHFFCL